MAAIAKVESDLIYMVHLVAFSAVAIAAVICGVGALLRHRWGGVGLRWVSILAATYYLGAAGLSVLWPSQMGLLGRLVLFSLIAPTALPFVWIASALGRLLRRTQVESLQTSQGYV